MAEAFKYIVMLIYIGLTFYLSFIGMKKIKDLKGFSISNKDMSPWLVGITMAASISSTATFVINPGFVYVDGVAAFMHYGVAALLGILTALTILTKGFKKLGESAGSLTIPHWIMHRYGSRALATFFALINLLSITFIVLILVGCAMIMSTLFGVTQHQALVFMVAFVFSYVLMGGSYAHAYTNAMQGIMMIAISAFLFFHGYVNMDGSFFDNLNAVSANYASFINPDSKLYYSFFSIYFCGFFITAALMFQPHIFSKILYIKEDKDIAKFLFTTVACVGSFALILAVGFFARFKGLEVPSQDAVVNMYIKDAFVDSGVWWGPYAMSFIAVALLAAGMSTLDGILVALSSMVINDIYYPMLGEKKTDDHAKRGLNLSRWTLIALGLISLAIAWNPPKLVGIFAQAGVYGLAAASFVPIVFGVLLKNKLPVWVIFTAALIGLFGHLYLFKIYGIPNPAITASIAMISSFVFAVISLGILKITTK